MNRLRQVFADVVSRGRSANSPISPPNPSPNAVVTADPSLMPDADAEALLPMAIAGEPAPLPVAVEPDASGLGANVDLF